MKKETQIEKIIQKEIKESLTHIWYCSIVDTWNQMIYVNLSIFQLKILILFAIVDFRKYKNKCEDIWHTAFWSEMKNTKSSFQLRTMITFSVVVDIYVHTTHEMKNVEKKTFQMKRFNVGYVRFSNNG